MHYFYKINKLQTVPRTKFLAAAMLLMLSLCMERQLCCEDVKKGVRKMVYYPFQLHYTS